PPITPRGADAAKIDIEKRLDTEDGFIVTEYENDGTWRVTVHVGQGPSWHKSLGLVFRAGALSYLADNTEGIDMTQSDYQHTESARIAGLAHDPGLALEFDQAERTLTVVLKDKVVQSIRENTRGTIRRIYDPEDQQYWHATMLEDGYSLRWRIMSE